VRTGAGAAKGVEPAVAGRDEAVARPAGPNPLVKLSGQIIWSSRRWSNHQVAPAVDGWSNQLFKLSAHFRRSNHLVKSKGPDQPPDRPDRRTRQNNRTGPVQPGPHQHGLAVVALPVPRLGRARSRWRRRSASGPRLADSENSTVSLLETDLAELASPNALAERRADGRRPASTLGETAPVAREHRARGDRGSAKRWGPTPPGGRAKPGVSLGGQGGYPVECVARVRQPP
jgi:hypothetical protein